MINTLKWKKEDIFVLERYSVEDDDFSRYWFMNKRLIKIYSICICHCAPAWAFVVPDKYLKHNG